MKNFLVFVLFSVIGLMAFADIGPVNRSVSLDSTGTVQAGSEEKFYTYVKNESGGTLTDGTAVILAVATDNGYSVTTSATAGEVPHCIMAQSCTNDKLCKCQTWGRTTGANFDQTSKGASAGHLVFISESNAGFVMAEGKSLIAASDVPIGVFLDDVATSGEAEIFIKLR